MLPNYLINLVKHFEGCLLTSYEDCTGVLTIGYGHTGKDVHTGQTITQLQANNLLNSDLTLFWNAISNHTTRELKEYEQAALTDFAYNLGCENLFSSTLWKLAMENENDLASEQFPLWCHAGGKVLEGLVIRREAESKMFLGNLQNFI